jgi:hypothetical protein
LGLFYQLLGTPYKYDLRLYEHMRLQYQHE